MSAEPTYKIHAGPPLVSQICLLCGAEAGSRAIHDAWHKRRETSTATPDVTTVPDVQRGGRG